MGRATMTGWWCHAVPCKGDYLPTCFISFKCSKFAKDYSLHLLLNAASYVYPFWTQTMNMTTFCIFTVRDIEIKNLLDNNQSVGLWNIFYTHTCISDRNKGFFFFFFFILLCSCLLLPCVVSNKLLMHFSVIKCVKNVDQNYRHKLVAVTASTYTELLHHQPHYSFLSYQKWFFLVK